MSRIEKRNSRKGVPHSFYCLLIYWHEPSFSILHFSIVSPFHDFSSPPPPPLRLFCLHLLFRPSCFNGEIRSILPDGLLPPPRIIPVYASGRINISLIDIRKIVIQLWRSSQWVFLLPCRLHLKANPNALCDNPSWKIVGIRIYIPLCHNDILNWFIYGVG